MPHSPAAQRVLAVLHARHSEPLSLDDVARAAGLSRAYTVRMFRDQVGVTPHRYLMQLRVERARTLLADGTRSVDVACACGFYDQSHLTRWFIRTLGITPARYAATFTAPSAPLPLHGPRRPSPTR